VNVDSVRTQAAHYAGAYRDRSTPLSCVSSTALFKSGTRTTRETASSKGDARDVMRRKTRSSKPEMLSRNVEITSFGATVRIGAVHRKGDEPEIESQPWLELRGTATEPVKGVKDVKISLYPQDKVVVGTARPASVGAIVGARPTLHAVISWPHVEFDRVWTLAIGGHLKLAHLYFTKPHYNSGLVVSASFSNELEE
jgi:hypothetical protein